MLPSVEQVWPAVESVGADGPYGGVTFFEMMTVLAMVHFRDIGADLQVLEVGLGGRLDATNIVIPEVSVITSISIDHVATLGDTIRKIAAEKAGIIKPGIPCVVAPQAEPDAIRLFEETARDRQSQVVSVADRFLMRSVSDDLEGQSFTLSGTATEYSLSTPLLGDYQIENVATAVAAVEVLVERGFTVPVGAIQRGVREVSWPGRFQVSERDGRTLVIDGAHNPYSMGRLVENLQRYFQLDRVVLVFGSLGGHSAEGMLEALSSLAPDVVAVQSRHPRSARAGVTAETVRRVGCNLVGERPTVAEGLRHALEIARPQDLILCTGSVALVAEVIEELEGIEPEIYESLEGPVDRPISPL